MSQAFPAPYIYPIDRINQNKALQQAGWGGMASYGAVPNNTLQGLSSLRQAGGRGTINSLKGEYESLLKESSSVLEDLQKSIDEASPKVSELTKELIRETPEEFLNKSHIGNIGTKVFDIQRNYVDISLRLPYRPTYSEV